MDKLCSTLLMFIFCQVAISTPYINTQTYIIYMDTSKIPSPFTSRHSWYLSTLFLLSPAEDILPVHLYTYTHVFNGFSAILTESHLKKLKKMSGHGSIYPELFGYLCTTHTPQFLRLNMETGLWPVAGFGNDIIIGIIETGIWPESKSFNDYGMPPVPPRWHGTCEIGPGFTLDNCNNKLIGARLFNKGMKKSGFMISHPDDYNSPRDYKGHGTATSSVAAGSRVSFANFFGYANGTATGMAYKSMISIYKVAFTNYNPNLNYSSVVSDMLAGIDQAIEDKVDVILLPFFIDVSKWYEDPIAIGTFAAMEKGIFVSSAAGNSGPDGYTVKSGAPWVTTVGAGTIDRGFCSCITLEEMGTQIVGKSFFPENLIVDKVPLFFGHGNRNKEICKSLDPTEVKGKYVLCDFSYGVGQETELLDVVSTTGADGVIFIVPFWKYLGPGVFNGSFVAINLLDGELVKKYIREKGIEKSRVSIKFQVTMLGTKPAPQVSDFSSRGPVLGAPWILKPDLLAPGYEILTAWVPNSFSKAKIGKEYLVSDYGMQYGTSMSSAHVVGVAALLKSVHKQWSPAAIRSAMMTTTDIVDNENNPILDIDNFYASPLDFGAGHINPNRAMDPGLVYDLLVDDYINYICSLNIKRVQLDAITRRSNVSCDDANIDLNYPSFIVILNNINATIAKFNRVLTNVVDGSCTYSAIIEAPSGLKVLVEPSVIHFPRKFYKTGFKLMIEVNLKNVNRINYLGNYGYLIWKEVNGSHVVRSPIVSAYPTFGEK